MNELTWNHVLKRRAATARAVIVSAALATVVVVCAVWSYARRSPELKGGATGQNVLLITMDTTRYDALRCNGNNAASTPAIDRLASSGARFENCATAISFTLPSHASIMTSLYPYVHGIRENGSAKLAEGCTTLAEILKAQGYATGAEIASAVLNEHYGLNQGFETYHDVVLSGHQRSYPERRGDEVCEAALAQLDSLTGDGKPFFLWVHFYDPHDPYTPPGWVGGAMKDGYAGEVAFMDKQIGRLIDALDKHGVADDTLVVLVADHGEAFGEHGETGHGYFVYDTTLHVPLIFWRPGLIPGQREVPGQVRTIDIMPTILQLLGIEYAPESIQGQSLVPLLAGETNDMELAAYSESMAAHLRLNTAPLRSLREDLWKYVHAPEPSLFNLLDDPEELKDVADSEPERLQRMRDEMRQMIAEAPAPPSSVDQMIDLTNEEEARLRTLGYTGGQGSVLAEGETELDIFEPKGRDPRNFISEIVLNTTAITTLAHGDFAETARLLEEVLRTFPEAAPLYADLAQCMAETQRQDRAVELLQQAIKLDGNNLDYHQKLAVTYIRLGEYEKAVEELRGLLSQKKDDPSVLRYLGVSYVAQDRYEDAIKRFREGLDISPDDERQYRGLASVLYKQEEYAAAEKMLREALQKLPDSAQLTLELATAVSLQGREDEAISLCRKAVELDPLEPEARKDLAKRLFDREEYAEAIGQLDALLEADPGDFEARKMRANALQNAGRADEARADWDAVATANPEDLAAVQSQALGHIQAGDLAGAEAVLDRGLEIKAEAPILLATLAQVRQLQGRIDESIELYRKSLSIKADAVATRTALAMTLLNAGRTEEAVSELESAVESDPEDFDAHFGLAQALARLKRFDEASYQLNEAARIEPRNAAVPHARGVMRAMQKDFQGAIPFFEEALRLDPNHAPAKRDLEMARQRLGG